MILQIADPEDSGSLLLLVHQLGCFFKLPDAFVDTLPVDPSGQFRELVHSVLGSSCFSERVQGMALDLFVDVLVLRAFPGLHGSFIGS